MAPQLRSYTFYDQRPDFVSNYTNFPLWVLVAPASGQFRFQTDHASGTAGFGDLVLAAARGRFERFALSPIAYHVLQFQAPHHEEMMLRDGAFAVREVERLGDDLEHLKRYATRFDERAKSRVENLLGDLLHLLWETELEAPSGQDPLMETAARLLRVRAQTVFSMKAVSDELKLGAVAFTRRFRSAHNCTPIEFLTRERLEIARHLLLETSLSLDEIALRCGYASGFYLSNLWKKKTGIAPGAFRRQHRI